MTIYDWILLVCSMFLFVTTGSSIRDAHEASDPVIKARAKKLVVVTLILLIVLNVVFYLI